MPVPGENVLGETELTESDLKHIRRQAYKKGLSGLGCKLKHYTRDPDNWHFASPNQRLEVLGMVQIIRTHSIPAHS